MPIHAYVCPYVCMYVQRCTYEKVFMFKITGTTYSINIVQSIIASSELGSCRKLLRTSTERGHAYIHTYLSIHKHKFIYRRVFPHILY